MALTPESRPVGYPYTSLKPATDIQPIVGVYYDALGNPQRAYISADGSAANAVTVSPSDSVALAVPARALYIGTAGNVAVITVAGQTVTFKNVPNATTLPVQVAFVKASGTTASDILAIW